MREDSKNPEVSERLIVILKSMNIPNNRRNFNLNNLKWLEKHLKFKNSEHPNYKEAESLIKESLANKYYTY